MTVGLTGCGKAASSVDVIAGDDSRGESGEAGQSEGDGDTAAVSAKDSDLAREGTSEEAASRQEAGSAKPEDVPQEEQEAGLEEPEDVPQKEQDGFGLAKTEDIIEVPVWEPAALPDSEALDFVQEMAVGWNLGNTFDASNCSVSDEMKYETAWSGVETTQEMIHTVAAAGYRTIRIPVSWHNHVDENYQISGAWIDRVKEVVDWALAEDLYVIINIHHDNQSDFLYPSYECLDQSKEYARSIWEQVAECFAQYDERLIFETMNEPRQKDTDHEWWINVSSPIGKECLDTVNQLNQTAVDAIRANGKGYNGTRYIMIPGYCASPEFVLADAFVMPTDHAEAPNRILISVHAYTPYAFALAGENEAVSTDVFALADSSSTGEIDSFLQRLYDKYTSKGIGVVIGEFGARAKGDNLQARAEYTAYYAARARYYGITTCLWDNNAFSASMGGGELFGVFNRKENTFSYPQIAAQMIYYGTKIK